MLVLIYQPVSEHFYNSGQRAIQEYNLPRNRAKTSRCPTIIIKYQTTLGFFIHVICKLLMYISESKPK